MTNVKRVVGIILAAVGIFVAVFYSYMAYSNQESYVRLMCAVTWTYPCIAVNNAIMLGMGMLGIGLVIIATVVILLMK